MGLKIAGGGSLQQRPMISKEEADKFAVAFYHIQDRKKEEENKKKEGEEKRRKK